MLSLILKKTLLFQIKIFVIFSKIYFIWLHLYWSDTLHVKTLFLSRADCYLFSILSKTTTFPKKGFLHLRLLLLKASCYDIPFQLFFDLKNMFLSKARVKCHFQKKNNFFKKRRRKIKFWNELKIWFKNSYGKKSCVITNYIMNKIPLCQPIIFLNKRKRSF